MDGNILNIPHPLLQIEGIFFSMYRTEFHYKYEAQQVEETYKCHFIVSKRHVMYPRGF